MKSLENTMEAKISILKSGFKKQDIAKEMGMLRPNFSRLLRNGITDERREQIEEAIIRLKEKEV